MTIRELAKACEERDRDCKECPYRSACEDMSGHTPPDMISMVENNEDVTLMG